MDALVYDVFGASTTLAGVKTMLGLDKLTAGGSFTVTGGSINGTPIGATQAATGRFLSVKLVGTPYQFDDVVTHGQLGDAVTGVTDGLKSMASQGPMQSC